MAGGETKPFGGVREAGVISFNTFEGDRDALIFGRMQTHSRSVEQSYIDGLGMLPYKRKTKNQQSFLSHLIFLLLYSSGEYFVFHKLKKRIHKESEKD